MELNAREPRHLKTVFDAAAMKLRALLSAQSHRTATKSKGPALAAKPTLLAGGNPQIAKADGDARYGLRFTARPCRG
jgi:hypothetical protein